jgi:hypothetical protein
LLLWHSPAVSVDFAKIVFNQKYCPRISLSDFTQQAPVALRKSSDLHRLSSGLILNNLEK